MGDQGATIRMADKNDGAADLSETTGDTIDIAFEGIQPVLGADDLMAISLQDRNKFLEA